MTGKAIKPQMTAQQHLQEKQAARGSDLPPDIQEELKKSRENARILGSAPAIPAVTADQRTARVTFRLADGRIIEMAPPGKPHMLVLPAMFKNRDITDDIEDASHFTAAKIMQYVRSINGRELPDFIGRWEDVVTLMHELGDIGCRAVYENYAIHWPDIGGLYWTEIKKNVPG